MDELDEPLAKKRKLSFEVKKKSLQKKSDAGPTKGSQTTKTSKEAKAAKPRKDAKTTKNEKPKRTKKVTKGTKTKNGNGSKTKRKTPRKPHLVLHPNQDVKIWKRDPFFETSQKTPFISNYAHSRLVFRALYTKNYTLMKKLFKDKGRIRKLEAYRSISDNRTALQHAIALNDQEAILLLARDVFSKGGDMEERLQTPLEHIDATELRTGTYNFRSLGVYYVRRIMAGRGCREGNNALLKDVSNMNESWRHEIDDEDVLQMLKSGTDADLVRQVLCIKGNRDIRAQYSLENYYQVVRVIDKSLEMGHYKQAGELLKGVMDSQPRKKMIPDLIIKVLLSDEEFTKVAPYNMKRVLRFAQRVSVVHCAACRPDTRFLQRLLDIQPDIHVSDKQNRRLVHFAAACEGSGPLELLIKRGARIFDGDQFGDSPLHFAVRASRRENVELLLDTALQDGQATLDPYKGRYGSGGVSRPNKSSYTPLHMAVESGNLEMVKLLVTRGARVDAKLNVSSFNLTPLVLAAQFGFFDIAVFLIAHGAVVQLTDRLGRTAVAHAAMNGNTNVLSYLLNIGANPNLCDNSGNSPLHYAAAYGWFFCVQSLLQAGADVNLVNDWKTTPLSIAYVKKHHGIVDFLLAETDVDANFKDETGKTLMSRAMEELLSSDLYEQIQFLAKEKRAVHNDADVNGDTLLHLLANNDVFAEEQKDKKTAMATSVKIAKLLINYGSNIHAKTKTGKTAVMLAIERGNLDLTKCLVNFGCPVVVEKNTSTPLHYMCERFMTLEPNYLTLLKYLVKMDGTDGKQNLREAFRTMATTYSQYGLTPLLAACRSYETYHSFKDMSEENKKVMWKLGRAFIKFLIDDLGSDVDAVVSENVDTIGKWSAAEILANVKNPEHDSKKNSLYPALRMLLKYKPNLNTRDVQGHTPLTRSLMDVDRMALTKILLAESNSDVNCYYITKEKNGTEYKTWAVVQAALSGSEAMLKLIVDAGADVKGVDERTGYSPLHAVVKEFGSQHVAVKLVKMLVEHGADVNAVSKDKKTALHMATDQTKGRVDDNFDLIVSLSDSGTDLSIQDSTGRTPLHFVFVKTKQNQNTKHSDPIELMRILASRMTPDEVNIQDKFGMTALHRAAFRGANICCMYLLQRGADINVKALDGNTALTMAIKGHHESCAAVLIQEGACLKDPVVDPGNNMSLSTCDHTYYIDKVQARQRAADSCALVWEPLRKKRFVYEVEQQSLFEVAVRNDFQGVCFQLLEKPQEESGLSFGEAIETMLRCNMFYIAHRFLLTMDDNTSLCNPLDHGRNLLHKICLQTSSPDGLVEKVIQKLLTEGVSPTEEDQYGCTPLLYASLNRNYDLCKFFMKIPGVYTPTYKDGFNRSILTAAFWNTSQGFDEDFMSFLEKLHEEGADLNTLLDHPLHECVFGNQKHVQDPEYFSQHDCVKVAPLVLAIHQNNLTLVDWLVKHGADVNIKDSAGMTPMMHAVRENDVDIVKTVMDIEHCPQPSTSNEESPTENRSRKRKAADNVFRLTRKASSMNEQAKEIDMDVDQSPKARTDTEKNPFKKTSKVKLNAVDKNGWTVIHHVVCPLSFGTFDNDEIVFILAKAGAKLNVKNKKGETPLDLALKNGASKIAKKIQELEGVPEKNRRVQVYAHLEVTDHVGSRRTRPPFKDDAEKYISEHAQPVATDAEYQPKIDTNFDVENGEIAKDTELERFYDVMLTIVDVSRGLYGIYNFYQMQIVHQLGKDLYILFTRWGRIEDRRGQYQNTPYKSLDEAAEEFSKIFRKKTGNKWTEINRFENKPNKYRLAKTIKQKQKRTDVDFEFKSVMKSNCPLHLQHVITKMTNVKLYHRPLWYKFDTDVMPFGSLDREVLLKAKSVLEVISEVVQERTKVRKETTNSPEEEEQMKANYKCLSEQIASLSSDYFHLIPQKKYEFESVRPIDADYELRCQVGLVEDLLDIETAKRIILGAKYMENEMNPLDYVYLSLGCKMELMDVKDAESQFILRAIHAPGRHMSSSKPKVEAIYRLERDGEQTRMDKLNMGNRRLLFHGSGVVNYISILHHGLRIAPLSARNHGQLFGKGIYLSADFSTSMVYCDICHRDDDPMGYMLVCEVALGKTQDANQITNPGKGYDSLTAWEQPVSKYDIRTPTGCLMTLGGQIFVVFNPDQVCLRYLVQFRETWY